jgi:pilus assembly protein TadC
MPKLFRDTSVLPSLLFFILISSFGLALAPKDVYLAFSGQNYVYVPNSYHVADTGAFTAEFWMRLDATASDMYVV